VPKSGKNHALRSNRFAAKASMILILHGFWGDKKIGDAGADTSMAYDRHRLDASLAAGKRSSPNSRIAEKGVLRKALRRFIDDHGLAGDFELPGTQAAVPYARTRVRREDLARLLWAARGRKWDPKSKRWQPGPAWDPDRPGAIATDSEWRSRLDVKRTRDHVARAIILAAYTASTGMCVTRMRWTRAEAHDETFVELDGVPMLHRLGADAGNGKFAGKPVLLNRRVVAHLRRWRAIDAQRHERVIHFRDEALDYGAGQSFKNIVEDAGLPTRLRLDDLRYSAGAHLARRTGMVLRSGALLMGLSTAYYIEVYGHLAEDYQKRIMAAFARKPGKPTRGSI
jgi:hypothetical protein